MAPEPVGEIAASIDAMTVVMARLEAALRQRVRDLRLNYVVIALAGLALVLTVLLTLVNFRLTADRNVQIDQEALLRNKRAVCVNTINSHWQHVFGFIITDASTASRAAEGRPPLTPDEQRAIVVDFRKATELTGRIPEICYNGEPDETPLDR
jgi:hypothetical protein